MASTEDTVVEHHGQDVTFFMPDPFSFGIPDEEMEAVERASELAAHMYASGENPIASTDKDHGMSKITEGKVWEPYTTEGELNPNSYAAMGVFGTAELAVEALHRAGLAINGSNVKSLASTFQHIVSEAQENWTGSTSASDGANSRMRGALRTVLATLPMPFGEDAAAWDAWVTAAIRRCKSITAVALHLFSEERPDAPWEALAGVTPEAAPDALAPAPKAAAKAAPKAVAKAEPAPVADEPAPAADEPVEAPVEAPAPAAKRVVRKAAPKAAAPSEDIDFVPDSFASDDVDVFV
jgi:putative RecB family exonuclease